MTILGNWTLLYRSYSHITIFLSKKAKTAKDILNKKTFTTSIFIVGISAFILQIL